MSLRRRLLSWASNTLDRSPCRNARCGHRGLAAGQRLRFRSDVVESIRCRSKGFALASDSGVMQATLTEILAIWGAVTGTIGTLSVLVAVLTYRRDRPKVEVVAQAKERYEQNVWEAYIEMIATNHGRQPLTLVNAGHPTGVLATGRWPREREIPLQQGLIPVFPQLPALLSPGQTIDLSAPFLHEGAVRPYVVDAKGRVLWATAQPIRGFSRMRLQVLDEQDNTLKDARRETCPDCGGAVASPQATTPCQRCGGRGWIAVALRRDEVIGESDKTTQPDGPGAELTWSALRVPPSLQRTR